jgi:hypothetical protein
LFITETGLELMIQRRPQIPQVHTTPGGGSAFLMNSRHCCLW